MLVITRGLCVKSMPVIKPDSKITHIKYWNNPLNLEISMITQVFHLYCNDFSLQEPSTYKIVLGTDAERKNGSKNSNFDNSLDDWL